MIRPPSSTSTGIVLLLLGLAGFACFAITSPFRTLGPTLGFPLIVIAAGVLGKPGQFVRQLLPFVDQNVRVEAFGRELPLLAGATLHVDAIESLGFGVWIRLSNVSGGPSIKLKIAQPTTLTLSSEAAEIGFAGYVQWDSRRIKDDNGRRAPGTVVMTLAH